MEIEQLEKFRNTASRDKALRTIVEYYADHKATYTALSARGLVNGLDTAGTPVGLPKAREFLALLEDFGIAKAVRDTHGKISNVVNMKLNTREIGEVVTGDGKNLGRFARSRLERERVKERDIPNIAGVVKEMPSDIKVYPMRKASNVSITVVINGKPIILPLPDNLKTEELAVLIERLKRIEDGYDPRKK